MVPMTHIAFRDDMPMHSENTAFYDKVHNGRCPKWLTWENCIMFNLICHTESKEISLVIFAQTVQKF